MKKLLISFFAVALSVGGFAQQFNLGKVSFATDSIWVISGNDKTTDENEKKSKESCCSPQDSMFITYENHPEFPGGEEARMKFLAENIKYPIIVGHNPRGTVFVKFCVEKDGRISNVEVVRDVDDRLDKEAIRVIEAMPNWKPATQRGEPICMSFVMPIRFTLAG